MVQVREEMYWVWSRSLPWELMRIPWMWYDTVTQHSICPSKKGALPHACAHFLALVL